ncbi:MAG: hypothetical protein JNN17_06190 [Verrucomicrobiaceae bacterium]|nr:hypothetical protein [Verrucomicrobiaceae bacterium]
MNRYQLIILFACCMLASCGRSGASGASGAPSGMIRDFGAYSSPSGSFAIEVTRREKSLVDFTVSEKATGKQLVSDYVGSDAMRWFLWWETPTKLWGYGSDIGYFKFFDFSVTPVRMSAVTDQITIPQTVWEHLPTSLQKRYHTSTKK